LPAIKNINEELLLLSRLSKGELSAFDRLYWHYERTVFHNIMQLVRDTATAEDILQEVFLALWEKRETIRRDISVAGWLFVTSSNRSMDVLRKKLKEQTVAEITQDVDDAVDKEVFLFKEMRFQELEESIESLTGQKRKVFNLCKIKGYTYEEAANALNISKHTVKEYLSDAIHQIRQTLLKNQSLGIVIWFCSIFFKKY
jgi:RNA polymerase sigma-70 factor (family 1)